MNPSSIQPLPKWVLPVCCVSPSVALMGLAIAAIFGYTIAWYAFVVLACLCGRIFSAVLYFPMVAESGELKNISNN